MSNVTNLNDYRVSMDPIEQEEDNLSIAENILLSTLEVYARNPEFRTEALKRLGGES